MTDEPVTESRVEAARKAWIAALSALPDEALVRLYPLWSEDNWCAGWMSDEEQSFVRWIVGLAAPDLPHIGEWWDYEVKGVEKMRAELARLAASPTEEANRG